MKALDRPRFWVLGALLSLSGCQSWYLTMGDDANTVKWVKNLQIDLFESQRGLNDMLADPATPKDTLDKQKAHIEETQKHIKELVATLPPAKQKELGYEPPPKPFTDPTAALPPPPKPDPANKPAPQTTGNPVTGSRYGGPASGGPGAGTPPCSDGK